MGKTVQQITEQWKRNLAAAGETIRAGVDAVKESPMEQAARAKDRWKQAVMEAADDGRFEAGLRSVSLSDWKEAMKKKGVERLTSGAASGAAKMQKFLQEYMPVAEAISAECKTMPRGTLEDSIARVRYAMEKSKEFKKSRRR